MKKQNQETQRPKQDLTTADAVRGYYTLAMGIYKAREDKLLAELKKPTHPSHFAFHLIQKGTKSDVVTSLKTLIEVSLLEREIRFSEFHEQTIRPFDQQLEETEAHDSRWVQGSYDQSLPG
jgi:hypothetical protein